MKDIEKIGTSLKQFIEESMVEANKLEEELEVKLQERADKDAEIEAAKQQLDYIEMLKIQLENKLEILEEERAIIQALIEEKCELARRNKLENIINNVEPLEEEGK